jgi:putative FmdB family regulatory protein
MIYEYKCVKCEREFDVHKPMSQAAVEEHCECGGLGARLYRNSSGFFGEKVHHAEFNPALGCVVNSKRHLKEICDRKGLIEVGNEHPEKIHTAMDSENQAIRAKRYEDADRC